MGKFEKEVNLKFEKLSSKLLKDISPDFSSYSSEAVSIYEELSNSELCKEVEHLKLLMNKHDLFKNQLSIRFSKEY